MIKQSNTELLLYVHLKDLVKTDYLAAKSVRKLATKLGHKLPTLKELLSKK